MNQYDAQYSAKKSGCARYWWLILLVLLLPVVSCVALIGGGFFFGMKMIQKPVDAIVELTNEDSRVTDRLGTPLEGGMPFNVSNLKIENGAGSATANFTLNGPDGSAQVSGEATSVNDIWTGRSATVTFDDGTSIDIGKASSQSADESADDGVTLELQ